MPILSIIASTLWGWLKNPYVVLGLVLVGLSGYLWFHNHSQNKTIAKQAVQITTLQGTVKSDKVVIVEKGDSAKREVTHATIKQSIISAPKEDNASREGAIPPVILHTFDSLRRAHADAGN
jgi:hypothetical protein